MTSSASARKWLALFKTRRPDPMSDRRSLIAGNWKLNGTRETGVALAEAIAQGMSTSERCDVLLCPPFPYLEAVAKAVEGTRLKVGAQNVAAAASGAYTGEVSAHMLAELGVSHVIVGHSERRSLFGESDADVGARTLGALDAGLVPIVCVGETQAERESGDVDTVIARQLAAVRDAVGADSLDKLVVAYEPVWAIGTGLTASPDQAQAVHAMIRAWLAVAGAGSAGDMLILYGGSMKPGNAAELLAQADIDGGLIGGASLVAEDFLGICQATV